MAKKSRTSKRTRARRYDAADPRAVAFFLAHGGSSTKPGETRQQGRRRSAIALARAEAEAATRGWSVEWEGDPEPYQMGDAEGEAPSEVYGAVLRDEHGTVIASLWGIGDPTRAYRRVVEAELASEALAEETK